MQRTPEPELMEGQEQAFAYAAADFSVGDQALVDRLVQLFPAGLGTSVVDLGCGPGNISFRLARRWPQANVLGIDGAAAMLIRLPAAGWGKQQCHLGTAKNPTPNGLQQRRDKDAPTGPMARSLTQQPEDWTRDSGGCLTPRWQAATRSYGT